MKKKPHIQTELIFHNKVLLFMSNLLLSCCRYEEYKGFVFFFFSVITVTSHNICAQLWERVTPSRLV